MPGFRKMLTSGKKVCFTLGEYDEGNSMNYYYGIVHDALGEQKMKDLADKPWEVQEDSSVKHYGNWHMMMLHNSGHLTYGDNQQRAYQFFKDCLDRPLVEMDPYNHQTTFEKITERGHKKSTSTSDVK